MNFPTPTLVPDPQPIDVITEYLKQPGEIPVLLWRHCAKQWADGCFAFNPDEFFLNLSEDDEEEVTVPDDDGDDVAPVRDSIGDDDVPLDDDEDVPEEVVEETVENTITPEQRELMALYAPYSRALQKFWTDLMVFTEDNTSVADWSALCAMVEKFIAFIPSDRARLLRHVHRLNSARIEAEALMPRAKFLFEGSVLLDIRNNKFD